MLKLVKTTLAFVFIASASSAFAAETVTMNMTAAEGVGKAVGTIEISENKYGLLFTPDLHDLKPGVHGFHLHLNPNCGSDGAAAGGHFDPKNTSAHLGPYNKKGHLGDLPALYVDADGTAKTPVLAPRFKKISQLKNHALVIHAGGDNYSDKPDALGGGHGRMVCGIVK